MTVKTITVTFPGEGAFIHAVGTLPSEFARSHTPLMTIAPGNRVKAWGNLDSEYDINGVRVSFAHKGGGRFGANLSEAEIASLRSFVPEGQQQQVEPTPPKPSLPPLSSVNTESELTPVEQAVSLYNPRGAIRRNYVAARRGQRSPLTQEEFNLYWFARTKRSGAAPHKRGLPTLESDIEDSLEETEEWLAKWDKFIAWYDTQSPTEKEAAQHLNVERIGSDTLVSANDIARNAAQRATAGLNQQTHEYITTWREAAAAGYAEADVISIPVNGGHTSARDVYNNILGHYNRIRNGISERVEEIRSLVGAYSSEDASDDGFVDDVVDDVVAAGRSIGLEPHAAWNSRGDGHVWFTDSEGNICFYPLYWLHQSRGSGGRNKFSALVEFEGRRVATRNFIDLYMTRAIGHRAHSLSYAGRFIRDIGGLRGIAWVFDALEDEDYPGEGNPFRG